MTSAAVCSIVLTEEQRAKCFTLIVLLLSYVCTCSMSLPHAAVSLSAVCDCGISWSYSLVLCPMNAQQDVHIMSVRTCGIL